MNWNHRMGISCGPRSRRREEAEQRGGFRVATSSRRWLRGKAAHLAVIIGLILTNSASILAQTNAATFTLSPRVTGFVERFAVSNSAHVERRNVDVWLPPSYFTAAATTNRYPVLYVHDGQNVFDPATSFIGVDWGLDETATRLIAERKIPELIIVAVWNTPQRLAEYMPQRTMARAAEAEATGPFKAVREKPLGDAYLKFLVTELKPAVDRHYRTLTNRASTHIMGSSMGGLISLSALCEYPEVFAGAACLSTSWMVAGGIAAREMPKHLPDPATHKIYFDFGAEADNARYAEAQAAVDAALRKAGYQPGANWITKSFPGAEHSERAWRDRAHVPLQFLLGDSTNSTEK
jgi:predicted alpha/beta superfamily hydrolase